MADHVDLVLRQWGAQRPDLDVSPMAVIGRLSRSSRLIGGELARTFAAHGLDAASFDVLATLRRSGPAHRMTPAALTRSAMVTSGAITQRLDRLQARGLVTRTPSESDGRVVHVALTDEGLELIDRALPDHIATENRLLAGVSDAGRAALAAALRSLLESLGDTVPEERHGYENWFCEIPGEYVAAGTQPVRIEYDGEPGSGARPELEKALALLRGIRRTAPDQQVVLTVPDLRTLARGTGELASIAVRLREYAVRLEIQAGPLSGVHDPAEPGTTFFAVLAAAAQLEQDPPADHGQETGPTAGATPKPDRDAGAGPEPEQAAGTGSAARGGRPKVIDDAMLARARALREQGVPVAEIAGQLTITTGRNAGRSPSVASLYRALAQSDTRPDRAR
ncbi:MarR family transcriptional regulator [Streptomyces sp. NPDC002187]|uniref:MarR family transcriptional regulator n=1 Tax=Streptomyces sp. NPDC002187 TaxID=3364637 RepID=UPI0036BB5E83